MPDCCSAWHVASEAESSAIGLLRQIGHSSKPAHVYKASWLRTDGSLQGCTELQSLQQAGTHRHSVFMVSLQPLFEGLSVVIFPLHERFSSNIVLAWGFGWSKLLMV